MSLTSFINFKKRLHIFLSTRGFTLVEVMVSVGIMMLITSVVVFNQSKYTSGAALQNLANDISLTMRQAQVYGVGVKEFSPGSNDFSSAYGMVFIKLSSNPIFETNYIFFADRGTKNGVYDSGWSCPTGATSECLIKTLIPAGNKVSALCVIPATGTGSCTLGRIDITFVRPSTEAHIAYYDSGFGRVYYPTAKGARIKVSSPLGDTRIIDVYTTGQISVQ
jgi:type II secretory pathway pseudopilin PulG